jgi:hypothetical protein
LKDGKVENDLQQISQLYWDIFLWGLPHRHGELINGDLPEIGIMPVIELLMPRNTKSGLHLGSI